MGTQGQAIDEESEVEARDSRESESGALMEPERRALAEGTSIEKSSKRRSSSNRKTHQDDSLSDVSDGGEGLHTGQQEASHSKCILDLSFTKFRWDLNEDPTQFHRPNIQSLYDKERQILKASQD